MFSFHKPKIYRSLSGCCICRAKSSSSRFTDSKKYEAEFEKCFRIVEKRCGEICNACVLLVKRWKKLPTGTNRNWHHVVDARAGPGTKSFKNRGNLNGNGGSDRNERDTDMKKRPFAKSSANGLRKSAKAIQLMTSSDSESEEEIEDDLMICDDLIDSLEHQNDIDSLHPHLIDSRQTVNGGIVSSSKSSLRRSTRLAKSGLEDHSCNGGHSLDSLDSLSNDNSNTTGLNGVNASNKALMRKRKSAAERFFSFLDTTVWQKEKVCCGVIFKGPNNTILIYPELLNPCSCRQPQLASSTPPTPTSTSSSNSLYSVSSVSPTQTLATNLSPKSVAKSAFISAVSSPPKLLSPNSVELNSCKSALTTTTTNMTKQSDFLIPPKTLRHQDSFTSHSTSSISSDSTLSDGHGQDIDDQSSGVSSMVVLTGEDSDLALSDRLSTVSSTGLMDADDASSCSDAGSYETSSMNHHHHDMVGMVVVTNSGNKASSDSVPSLSYSAQAVV